MCLCTTIFCQLLFRSIIYLSIVKGERKAQQVVIKKLHFYLDHETCKILQLYRSSSSSSIGSRLMIEQVSISNGTFQSRPYPNIYQNKRSEKK